MGNFFIHFIIGLVVFQLSVFFAQAQLPDTRLNDTIIIQNTDTIYCSTISIPIIASNASGLPITYEITSGEEFILLANHSTLTPLGLGTFVLRAYSNGDATYKPGYTFLPIRVLSNKQIPVFKIEHDLPVKQGEDLRLWVPALEAGLSCVWETPTGTISNALVVWINNIQKYDEGIYHVALFENTCRISGDSLAVVVDDNTKLIIYELITPNNDGDNDVFYIENLEASPNTEVTIFNAWNQIVYHTTHYKNDWDGGGLPVGNYYYLVREQDCRCEDHKGILYIKK